MTPERRKLHRAAILATALDGLRGLALPLVVLALVGGSGDAVQRILIYGVGGTIFALVAAFVMWNATWWQVDGDAIRLRTGVMTEREVSVPLDRVQAIDTVRGPAQRLLGAVALHVQAAGGGKEGEIVLKAVAPEVAEQVREAVRDHRPQATVPGTSQAPQHEGARQVPGTVGTGSEWRLGFGSLLLAALTSGSLGVLVPVVAAGSQVLDDVLGVDDAERLLPDTPGEVLVAAAALVGVAWVLSFLGTIVAFAGFRVTRDGDRLRIRRGIIEQREASVPIARVHAVRVLESPLREPFGLAQVRLESAGYAQEAATAQALLPLVRRRDAAAVLERLVPELTPPAGALAPPPPRARRHYVVRAALLPLLAAGATAIVLGPPGLVAFALPLAAAAFGLAMHRTAGWRLAGGQVVLRRRGLQRTTLVADAHRLPESFTRTSWLQRRAGLSTAGVAVASGRRLGVADLEAADAGELLGRLAVLSR